MLTPRQPLWARCGVTAAASLVLAVLIVMAIGPTAARGATNTVGARSNARFVTPRPNDRVDVAVPVRGRVLHPSPNERYFLVVECEASGDLVFPQGELTLEADGSFSTDRVRLLQEYRYRFFVVATTDPDAAGVLASTYYRAYGVLGLPARSTVISTKVVVRREHSTGRWLPSGRPIVPSVTWAR